MRDFVAVLGAALGAVREQLVRMTRNSAPMLAPHDGTGAVE